MLLNDAIMIIIVIILIIITIIITTISINVFIIIIIIIIRMMTVILSPYSAQCSMTRVGAGQHSLGAYSGCIMLAAAC